MKRHLGRLRLARAVRFSPAFCGGLIEAPPAFEREAAKIGFSPAFCGGLIEAVATGPSPEYTIVVFPRILRGPH